MAGAVFKVNPDLQVLGGLAVEYRRDLPVMPFAGVRWRFAEGWTASLLFPRSGVEYEYSKQLAFFGGAGLQGGAFQVSEHFGDKFGRPELNNDSLTYWEIRFGGGARYRLLKNLALELDGGYMVLRRFVFRESDFTLKTDPAPYVQTSLRVSF
jgi:opacity protein-like surface antigen